MKSIKWLAPVVALIAGMAPANFALAQGCNLEQVKLVCGKGNDQSRFDAFSARSTAEIFDNPLVFLDNFERPSHIETYRKSLESVWRSVNRVERRERRKMRRRQISAAQFEEFVGQYDLAKANYEGGLKLYRTLIWFGKSGKDAPSS